MRSTSALSLSGAAVASAVNAASIAAGSSPNVAASTSSSASQNAVYASDGPALSSPQRRVRVGRGS